MCRDLHFGDKPVKTKRKKPVNTITEFILICDDNIPFRTEDGELEKL